MSCKPLPLIPLTETQKLLVQNNLPLAIIGAKERYYNKPHAKMTLYELISIANMGLIYGIQHYKYDANDPNNKRWYRYISKCIDGFILREMYNRKLIHIPRINRQKNRLYNSKRCIRHLKLRQSREKLTISPLIFDIVNKENEDTIDVYDYFHLLTLLQERVILLQMEGYSLGSIDKLLKLKYRNSNIIYHSALKILREAMMKDL